MRIICFGICFLLSFVHNAQNKLPLIKATSKNVSIKDGDYFEKDFWSLSPEAKPDVYVADRTRKTKWVTFYTDIDSIRIKVKPGSKHDFIILLNGKDSCYTQVVSPISSKKNLNLSPNAHDTIPFTLTKYNAIHVKAIVNNQDTISMHFDVGAFDFKITRDGILKKTHLLANQPDALSGKVKPNFNKMEKVFKLQIGNLVWNNPTVAPTGLTSYDMDGRIGYTVFENKIVEIDYDKSLLIVHSRLPKIQSGFVKSELEFIRSFVCVKGVIEINNNRYEGPFLFDTGADRAMLIDSTWAAKTQFPKDLKVLKTTTFRNPRGEKFESKTVLCPSFSMNTFKVSNIPISLLGSTNPAGVPVNFLGNDLLKRFNTILDFQKDIIYLKPNSLMNLPYKEAS